MKSFPTQMSLSTAQPVLLRNSSKLYQNSSTVYNLYIQEEVREMKIAINALQEKDAANAPSLSEDVSELKAMVASLQVPRAESPAASELPDNTPTWTEVARRKPHHSGGKGKGERGKNEKGGSGQGGSGQGGTKQPKERGVPNHRGPSTSQTKGKDSQHQSHQFQSLPGKCKVWTRKACSSSGQLRQPQLFVS